MLTHTHLFVELHTLIYGGLTGVKSGFTHTHSITHTRVQRGGLASRESRQEQFVPSCSL